MVRQNFKFRPTLFWDVDPHAINTKKHARYIIERIIDFGNDQEVRWMWKTYSLGLIRKVLKTSRSITPQSRPLWEALTKSQ